MGNRCCKSVNPCETRDEEQGLLSSSTTGSKTSARSGELTAGNMGPSEDDRAEDRALHPDGLVVTKQPIAVQADSTAVDEQTNKSVYSETITILKKTDGTSDVSNEVSAEEKNTEAVNASEQLKAEVAVPQDATAEEKKPSNSTKSPVEEGITHVTNDILPEGTGVQEETNTASAQGSFTSLTAQTSDSSYAQVMKSLKAADSAAQPTENAQTNAAEAATQMNDAAAEVKDVTSAPAKPAEDKEGAERVTDTQGEPDRAAAQTDRKAATAQDTPTVAELNAKAETGEVTPETESQIPGIGGEETSENKSKDLSDSSAEAMKWEAGEQSNITAEERMTETENAVALPGPSPVDPSKVEDVPETPATSEGPSVAETEKDDEQPEGPSSEAEDVVAEKSSPTAQGLNERVSVEGVSSDLPAPDSEEGASENSGTLGAEDGTHGRDGTSPEADSVGDGADITAALEKKQVLTDQEREPADQSQNGLNSSGPSSPSNSAHNASAAEIYKRESAEETELETQHDTVGLSEACSLGELVQDLEEGDHQAPEDGEEKREEESVTKETADRQDTETSEDQQEDLAFKKFSPVKVEVIPVKEKDVGTANEEEEGDEDLYRGAEEIEGDQGKGEQSKPLLEITIPGVKDRCSLAAAVDILTYSEREWKGNTAKSSLIRKGYAELAQTFSSLRRVRGDNFCALRATLYQLLSTSTEPPAWLLEEHFLSLPEKLEDQDRLIGGWLFPKECAQMGKDEDSVGQLRHFLELLQKKWQAAASAAPGSEERERVCEELFQSGEEEYGLLEALKFLMLAKAVELHGNMQAGQDVPVFCWLLFARDTSPCPRTLLVNHLSQIGFSGGAEQVEMFLLGYALQHTIQTYRLYKAETEEFITYYPDDHQQDWPSVSLVTEDDRHYNVPVRRPVEPQVNDDLTVL
ncbi:treacle protein [Chanos chanos]|uniref:Treacle protein-like n=1 Tax=Chanos chanos TaxID=29144 RepID=A0A6J2UYF8_CHACN|nr:treacle protein-like [Chanos chanos]XP_030625665.1 treacle protein-like [Chanos chanos]